VVLDGDNAASDSAGSEAEKMTDTRPLVSVCICTYRRPSLLAALLDTIFNQLEFPGPSEIIVVDNDAHSSAADVISRFTNRQPVLRDFQVPTQNISLARNRAVAESRGDWIAMIDDDELPHPDWLVGLHRCAINLDADAVFGPVLPRFPDSTPQWIIDGRFFERPRHETGTVVSPKETRSGNVLMNASVLRDLPEPFDPDFGLTGGEDSKLFRSLLAEGKRLFWCDDAKVEEIISDDRVNGGWLVKRWFRGGQTYAKIALNRDELGRPQIIRILVFVARSMFLALAATVMLLVSIPFGKKERFKWLKLLVTQAGKMCPPNLFKYQEYEDRRRSS
jgi:succinoglycan biosynthesis protein ExoM